MPGGGRKRGLTARLPLLYVTERKRRESVRKILGGGGKISDECSPSDGSAGETTGREKDALLCAVAHRNIRTVTIRNTLDVAVPAGRLLSMMRIVLTNMLQYNPTRNDQIRSRSLHEILKM